MSMVSRRQLLAGSVGLGLGWVPIGRYPRATAGCPPPPPDFPPAIDLYRQEYRNWSGELRVDDVWTCAPRTPADVVALANWAHTHSYRLRAQGFRHGWAPLTITADAGCASQVVLVDTTAHLTAMSIVAPGRVRVQAGAEMETLLGFLEREGYGLLATPAPGDLSVGGVVAIDGHGTAVPATGESRTPGTTYGSLSNLVTSLDAVVWDPAAGTYVLRTFHRADPDGAAFLASLGRAFVTEVTLQVGRNSNLRCVSRVDVSAEELFAAPGSAGQTFDSFVDGAGRAEAIWFAFTAAPWLKVWSVSPTRPATSRPVTGPYNYPFSDNAPPPVAALAGRILAGAAQLAPAFGQAQYAATAAGLTATASADIWGRSKNLLLYVRPTTIRMHANGYAVLTDRGNIQQVVHEFTAFYQQLLRRYADRGRFPVNGAVEIRVTGLDDPGDVDVPGAQPPALSAVQPREDHPEWDVAVWLDVLTLPGTAYAEHFYRELEQFIFATFTGARVEWSKGWAYTDEAAWSAADVLHANVPASFPGWEQAVATLNRHDPHRVFSTRLLDDLL